MKRVAFIGECMIELNGILPNLTQTYGGDTLNAAIYLSRLTGNDIEVSYITVIGTDQLSTSIEQLWQDNGICTDLVLQDDQRGMGLYLISVDKDGERSFLYWRKDSAASHLMQHPNIEDVFSKLSSFDVIFISGISLAILTNNDRELLLNKLKVLRQSGVTIVFDSNYRANLWEDIGETQRIYNQIYSISDVALVTFDDEFLVYHDKNIDQTFRRILDSGVDVLIVKNGEHGAVCRPQHNIIEIPTKAVNVIDSTSAGDSFNAGFLASYLMGNSIEQCCEMANEVARIVVQYQGAIIPEDKTCHLKCEGIK
jgi:2-dehydro-3-deoxygluconokinase